MRDQVEALSRIPDIELEMFAFEPGGGGATFAGRAPCAAGTGASGSTSCTRISG